MRNKKLNQKWVLGTLLGLVLLAGLAAWWTGFRQEGNAGSSGSGPRIAPEFSLKDETGRERKLSEWRGHPVMIHFWATWCPPCLDEIQEWTAMARESAGPVRFVAISLDKSWEDARKLVPKLASTEGTVFLLDEEQTVSDRYGSYQFPETYLVDSEGRVSVKLVGPQQWRSPKMKAWVADWAARKPEPAPPGH